MEAAVEVLRDVQVGLWIVLAIAAFKRWRSQRHAPGALILAIFGTLAVISVAGLFLPDPPESASATVLVRALIAAIVLIPYLLFRFAGTFRKPSRAWKTFAAAATAVVVAFGFLVDLPAQDEPRTAAVQAFVVLLVGQWVSLSMYTAVSLWQGGSGQPRIARKRMRTLALGATGLSVVLVVAGFADPQSQPGVTQVVAQILTFISAPLFLLGFAPPRVVVWWWRRADEAAMRKAHEALMGSATPSEVARSLLPHAVKIIGGSGGTLRDSTGAIIGTYSGPEPRSGSDSATETVQIPMSTGSIEISTSRYTPYFGIEDVAALADLAALTEIALARAEVLADQRRLAEELRLANQAMAEFVAIASHDLRTPLTVVQGLAQTLSRNWQHFEDAAKVEQVNAIVRQSSQLSRIVEDLLTVSKIDSDVMKPEPEMVDLHDAVATIARDLEASIPGVEVDIPEATTAWVDPQHLARMVSNYLRNAATYGEPPVRITCEPGEARVILRVHDNGPGVSPALRDRLFEKFWRADKAKSRSASGTGLGLAIVKGLARAAEGDAWYEHDEAGPRFAVSLPSHPPQRLDRRTMEKARVLVVVEDDADVRLLVRTTLSVDARIEIAGEAANARDAIEIARTMQPGLIILDHSLEGDLTGLEAAPLLKEAAPLGKILLFTAFDLASEARAEQAVDAFLPKSRINDLLTTVRDLLELPVD